MIEMRTIQLFVVLLIGFSVCFSQEIIESETDKDANVAFVAVVVSDLANVRSDPDSKSKVVLQISKGDQVTIVEYKDPWFRVQTESGRGWMHKTTLRPYIDEDSNISTQGKTPFDEKINYRKAELNELRIRYSEDYVKVKAVKAELAKLEDQRRQYISDRIIPKNEKLPTNQTELLQMIVKQNERIITLLQMLVTKPS